MDKAVRIFIAVNVNPQIRQIVVKTQNHLRVLDCNIKWVKPENIHLTLKFLGNVEIKAVETIKQAFVNSFQNSKPIQAELTQLGAFPDLQHPRILWIGLHDSKKKIGQWVTSLESAFEKIGFERNQKLFSPHITIGRTRSAKNLSVLSQAMPNYSLPPQAKLILQNIILYKSVLTSDGPLYEPLHKIKLK